MDMHFSVLLSLYTKENPLYFNQAISSIWDEQTLKPNQIVLVKDGPLTPELDQAIDEWGKKLGDILTIVALPENIGLGAALNEGLKYCKYDLVARMDTDDISLPERFEKQISFMANNPDIAVSSTWIEEIDSFEE
jgi:glycosyltransferase involved in cell wall biosynthesis